MNATNFSENLIPKINGILDFVLSSPYSDFYRNKHKNQIPKEIKSYEDFQKISFLTKDEILAVPVEKRTFVPEKEIKYYSFTSGTTSAKKPLVMPHNSFYHEVLFEKGILNQERLLRLGVKKLLVLLPPSSPGPTRLLTAPQDYLRIILSDIHNLKFAAKVCRELKIEAIATTATILDFFIDELKNIGFDLGSLRLISLGGESCSSLRLDYFKSVFPNAFFHSRYGTSEIGAGGGRYYQCQHLEGKSNAFHLKPDSAVLEIMDEKEKILPFGKPGQIVYTELAQKAFPLIRYQTADVGKLIQDACPCGSAFTLKLEGRYGLDVLKTHGVTINGELAAEALKSVENYILPRFQIHVREKEVSGKIKPQLEIQLQLKNESEELSNDFTFKEMLKENISSRFYLSSKATMKQLTEKNVFLPLEIVFRNFSGDKNFKSKKIISHLS